MLGILGVVWAPGELDSMIERGSERSESSPMMPEVCRNRKADNTSHNGNDSNSNINRNVFVFCLFGDDALSAECWLPEAMGFCNLYTRSTVSRLVI